MNIYGLLKPLMSRFRHRRFVLFKDRLSPTLKDKMLDVGGFPGFWTQQAPIVSCIECLNIHEVQWEPECAPGHHITMSRGNGCALEMPDQAFDIVFSNSVIEHVGTWEEQKTFALEARRVGRKLWIQTPAYECPVEPHYVGFYIHRLPKNWQLKLIRWCTLWGWLARPKPEQVAHEVRTIRLLKKREMEELFPDCEILTEKLFGILPKSYIAIRHSDSRVRLTARNSLPHSSIPPTPARNAPSLSTNPVAEL